MNKDSFGKNLKKFRKEKKMSQGALATKLDVRQTTISNYENDLRFPNADILNKISIALNVSLDDLIMTYSKEGLKAIDYEKMSNEFIEKILDHKEKEATEMIITLAKKGYDILSIFDKLLKNSLYKVGDLWSIGEVSIPMEHHITYIVEGLINTLSKYNKIQSSNALSVLLITPGNEPHTVGLKIIKEYFRKYGWKTFLLQGSVPWSSLTTMIKNKAIDLVCISVTMHENVNQTKALIDFIRQSTDVKIMVGGQVFNNHKDIIDLLEPDYYYNDHEELINFLEKENK